GARGRAVHRAAGPRQESLCEGDRPARSAAWLPCALPRSASADRGDPRGSSARGAAQVPCADEGRRATCDRRSVPAQAAGHRRRRAGRRAHEPLREAVHDRDLEPAGRRLAEAARRRRRRHAAARPPDASLASAEVRRQELASERGRRSSCKARSERVNTHRPAAVNWGNLTRPRMGEFRVAAGELFLPRYRAPDRHPRWVIESNKNPGKPLRSIRTLLTGTGNPSAKNRGKLNSLRERTGIYLTPHALRRTGASWMYTANK